MHEDKKEGEETKRIRLDRNDLQALAMATVHMSLGFCCFFLVRLCL